MKKQFIASFFRYCSYLGYRYWQTNYDFDHSIAKKTRLKLLNMAHEEMMLVNAFHFDFPGLGHVSQSSNKWKWVAQR